MTQRYRFTLIRDTPVTINYSESVRIHHLFFFFGKIYLFEIFNDLSSLNYPKFKFSLSRFSQFPNASLLASRFQIFRIFQRRIFGKKLRFARFRNFQYFPFFFFNIKLFENKFLEFLILNYPRIFFFTTSRQEFLSLSAVSFLEERKQKNRSPLRVADADILRYRETLELVGEVVMSKGWKTRKGTRQGGRGEGAARICMPSRKAG